MNHSHYQDCCIPLSDTVVKRCKCYVEYWKRLKERKNPFVQFDYSIEKAFTYRKYFKDDNLLYHFCINCLHEVTMNILMNIIQFEVFMRRRAACIFKFKQNSIPLGEVCCVCINLIVHCFSCNFFIDV